MKCYSYLIALIVSLTALSTDAADVGVRMGSYFFDPAVLVIRPGDRVIWTNVSGISHDSTGPTNLWRSANVSPNGGTYAFTFNNPGQYRYLCVQHTSRNQTGTVNVVNLSLAAVSATPTNAQFEIRGGQPGLRAVVEAGGTLGAFAPIATNVFPASGTLRFTNNAPPVTNRFYRTRARP